jgi:hypothetical protein
VKSLKSYFAFLWEGVNNSKWYQKLIVGYLAAYSIISLALGSFGNALTGFTLLWLLCVLSAVIHLSDEQDKMLTEATTWINVLSWKVREVNMLASNGTGIYTTQEIFDALASDPPDVDTTITISNDGVQGTF